MTDKSEIKIRLTFWTAARDKMMAAYLALIDGGVKSYTIDDRSLTRFDIPELLDKIEKANQRIGELTAQLEGRKARKAFGVILRDW